MEYDMARTDLAVELNESISKKKRQLKGDNSERIH